MPGRYPSRIEPVPKPSWDVKPEPAPEVSKGQNRNLVLFGGMLVGSLMLSLTANKLVESPEDCIGSNPMDIDLSACVDDLT